MNNNNFYRNGIRALFEAVVLNEIQGRGAYTGGRSGTARPSSKTKASESAPEARPGEPVVRATGDGTSKEDAALQRKTNAAQDAMKAATTPSIAPPQNLPDPTNEPYVPMDKRRAETEGGLPTNPDNRKVGRSKFALTRGQIKAGIAKLRGNK